jgi:ABC-2 type transport system permease protein
MNARWAAVRAGLRRGGIELRQTFTTPSDLAATLIITAIFLGVMLYTRATTVPGTHFPLGTAMLPSVLGMTVGFNGLALTAGLLTIEHEDGTLLRAKAIPHGMIGYMIGKVVTVSGTIIISVTGNVIAGLLLFSGLSVRSAGSWLTLVWVLVLGLVATLPIGAVLGCLFPSARSAALLNLAVFGLIAISGIFYPITHLPQWMQWGARARPIPWPYRRPPRRARCWRRWRSLAPKRSSQSRSTAEISAVSLV